MRVPQVSERIKEAPAQALRGVFAGIGQLLLITDKLRNKTSASQQVPKARAPEPAQTRADTVAPPAPAPVSSAPSAPAPVAAAPAAAAPAASAPAAAAPAPAAAAAPAPAAAAAPAPAASAPAAARVPAARNFDKTGNVRLLTSAEAAADAKAPAVGAPAAGHAKRAEAAVPAAEAPLPNYDELSIASLRARLRNLDPTELRQLVAYERAHADRADVIAMFERRIAKLEDETSADKRGEAEAEAEIEAREDVEAEVQDEVGPEAEGEE
jgi:hypothetical protein